MSHGLPLDRVDAKLDHSLPVAVLPFRVVLAVLLLEYNDLVAARFPKNCRRDRRAADCRRSDFRLIAADHQHFIERDFVLVGAADHVTLDEEAFSLRDAILLSTRTNDGEHDNPPRNGEWQRLNLACCKVYFGHPNLFGGLVPNGDARVFFLLLSKLACWGPWGTSAARRACGALRPRASISKASWISALAAKAVVDEFFHSLERAIALVWTHRKFVDEQKNFAAEAGVLLGGVEGSRPRLPGQRRTAVLHHIKIRDRLR